MSRIESSIFNGTHKLVLSETLCIDPTLGLKVHIPLNPEKTLILSFEFGRDKKKEGKFESTISGDTIQFKFTNFQNMLGASLINPINFSVGESKFLLKLYGFSNNESNLLLTLSIFSEGGKVAE